MSREWSGEKVMGAWIWRYSSVSTIQTSCRPQHSKIAHYLLFSVSPTQLTFLIRTLYLLHVDFISLLFSALQFCHLPQMSWIWLTSSSSCSPWYLKLSFYTKSSFGWLVEFMHGFSFVYYAHKYQWNYPLFIFMFFQLLKCLHAKTKNSLFLASSTYSTIFTM